MEFSMVRFIVSPHNINTGVRASTCIPA